LEPLERNFRPSRRCQEWRNGEDVSIVELIKLCKMAEVILVLFVGRSGPVMRLVDEAHAFEPKKYAVADGMKFSSKH
jgi:hypothetical protein